MKLLNPFSLQNFLQYFFQQTSPLKIAAILLLTAALTGCGEQASNPAAELQRMAPSAAPVSDMSAKVAGGAAQSLTESSEPVESSKRYVALRHAVTVEVPASKMQAAFDEATAYCEQLKCTLLSANFNRATPYNPPSASLALRVPPRSVSLFLDHLAKSGEILQHHRNSEDKTDAVIDAEARIKNLTELRNRLRVMLQDKSAKFRDLIEIERELANTQAQLDSIQGIRKALAQETDLVAVNIDFVATQSVTEQGFLAPIILALDNAGQVLMQSLANVITFIVGALPWLIFGIPVIILVRKFWTRIKAKLM